MALSFELEALRFLFLDSFHIYCNYFWFFLLIFPDFLDSIKFKITIWPLVEIQFLFLFHWARKVDPKDTSRLIETNSGTKPKLGQHYSGLNCMTAWCWPLSDLVQDFISIIRFMPFGSTIVRKKSNFIHFIIFFHYFIPEIKSTFDDHRFASRQAKLLSIKLKFYNFKNLDIFHLFSSQTIGY